MFPPAEVTVAPSAGENVGAGRTPSTLCPLCAVSAECVSVALVVPVPSLSVAPLGSVSLFAPIEMPLSSASPDATS